MKNLAFNRQYPRKCELLLKINIDNLSYTCKLNDMRDTSYKLLHVTGPRGGRFFLLQGKNILLETGSSLRILRMLRKLGLEIPAVMAGPACWEKAWSCTW